MSAVVVHKRICVDAEETVDMTGPNPPPSSIGGHGGPIGDRECACAGPNSLVGVCERSIFVSNVELTDRHHLAARDVGYEKPRPFVVFPVVTDGLSLEPADRHVRC